MKNFILPYSVKEISVIIRKELSETNLDLLAQRLYYRQRWKLLQWLYYKTHLNWKLICSVAQKALLWRRETFEHYQGR